MCMNSNGQRIMRPEDAASYIRTAFGSEHWRGKVRRVMDVNALVRALWVAQKYARRDDLGGIIKWANEMGRADDLHWH